MRIKLLLIFILFYLFSYADKPIVKWAKSIGSTFEDTGQSIATDINGNIYVTGYFSSSSITFGNYTLINSNQNNPHIYIVKYDSIGTVLWAKSSGNFDFAYSLSITVDKSGNSYISGFFKNSQITFGNFSLTNYSGGYTGQLFLVKYDTSGKEQWAKTATSYSSNAMYSVSTDNLGNVYATGHFQDSSIFFGSVTLYNSNFPNMNVFLVKFDALGNTIWGKSFGGNNTQVGNSVFVDINNNVLLTGVFRSSSISFGSYIINNKNSGTQDLFIAKFDSNGVPLWAKSSGGNSEDIANSVVSDQLGNVYVGGSFNSSSISFGNYTLINPSSSYIKNFITKYDTNGTALWAKSGTNSTQNDAINSLSTDKYGNIYSTGYFDSPSITFDTIKLTNNTSFGQDLFVTKQDMTGKVLWAKGYGGAGNDYGKSIAADIYGNIYLTGQFTSPNLLFDKEKLPNNSFSNDIFVTRLSTISKPDTLIVNYCASDPIATLNANDGYIGYKWLDSNGQEIGNSKIVDIKNPADRSVYTCNMTPASGVMELLNVMIIKYELNVDFSYQTDCKSNTVQFTNLSTNSNGNLSYKWNFGNGNISTEANPQFTFNTPGLHDVFLEVSNPPSTCSKFTTHTINTLSPLFIKIEGDSTFCPGYSVTLKGQGADHYLWSTGEKTDSIKINSPERISVIGYSITGCVSDRVYKTISKEPDWTLTVDGNRVICNNDSTLLTASGGKYYIWNNGKTTPSITVTSSGTYSVKGFNDRGCLQESQNIVVVKDLIPQMDFSISKPTIDSRNNELACEIPSVNDVQYTWEMGDDQIETGASITHTYNITTLIPEYKITLTARTINGCVNTKTKTIDVIPFIPNVFTPNIDGINDVFMADYDLQIQDRNGIILYKGNKGWDGTYKSKPVDPDTYFYLITYTDKNNIVKSKKGYITLIR